MGSRSALSMESTSSTWLSEALLERAVRRRAEGLDFRSALEALLLELDPRAAGRLMQLLREGRAAWLPLLHLPPRRVLFLGHPLSGALVALALAGFDTTVLAPDRVQLALARWRDEELGGGRSRFVVGELSDRLPFADGAFELVVRESAAEPLGITCGADVTELRRVCSGELAWTVENRLAYKRSKGERARFEVARPAEFARRAFLSRGPQKTWIGYRRALDIRETGCGSDGYALYPHSHDFSHVVGLTGSGPRLSIGPGERRNRWKILAQRMGLFPWLTPSYLFLSGTGDRPDARWCDALLEEVAGALSIPTPRLETLVATRGNTAVCIAEGEATGFVVHVPLSPAQERQARRHHARLAELAARHPEVPAPRPLWEGSVHGLYACVEERLRGWNASQSTGDLGAREVTYASLAESLAILAEGPASPADEDELDRLVDERVRHVAPRCGVPATRDAIQRLGQEARAALRELRFPRVLQHADLRAKHVQVAPSGEVYGLLDWGSSERADLPYFDLLNLILHDRKQEADSSLGEAWRLVESKDGLRPFERAALRDHAERLGLDRRYCEVIHAFYPVLVGAMAERNWDFSRPRWLHASFGI